jgi:uncharacterized delta-60 repeat protein
MKYFFLPFLLALVQICFGQAAGTIDAGYGTAGIATTGFGVSTSESFASAVQPDGKVVAAGNYTTGGNAKIAFVRYSSAGVIDPTFGTNGKLQIVTPFASIIKAIHILPNGNILAAGVANTSATTPRPILVRLTSAGAVDATFGTAGQVAFDGGLNGINDIKIDASGKIVGCGRLVTGPTDLVVFRLNANGTPDATFGTAGFAKVPSGGNLVTATRVAIQGTKIIVSGFFNPPNTFARAITARLNANGTLDTTFGTAGKFVSALGGEYEFADNVAVAPDQKIVHSGRIQIGNAVQVLSFRLTENGQLDATYGTAGKANFSVGTIAEECQGLAIQSDGKVLLGGTSNITGGKRAFIVRLTKAGVKDTGFGTAGQTLAPSGTISTINGLIIQSDKKIVAAGTATPSGATSFSTFRFNGGTYVGTEEPSLVEAAALFPNPAAAGTEVQLQLDMLASDVVQIELYSLDGSQVALLQKETTLTTDKNQIALRIPAGLAGGMYFVQVRGTQFQHQQVLIVE